MGAGNASEAILVAQDGSRAAKATADVAIFIAKSLALSIQGLYVVDEPLIMDTYARHRRELGISEKSLSRAELVSRSEFQGLEAMEWLKIRSQGAVVPVAVKMLAGGVPQLVLREAASSRMLAMGRRGHGHSEDIDHLGRNFRTIAHHIHKPLLSAGDGISDLKRVLLAYNAEEHAQHALRFASEIQHHLPECLVVLYVDEGAEDPTQSTAEIKAGLTRQGLANYCFIYRKGEPAAEILAAAAENEVDLIVLGSYRHSLLLEWVVGSTLDRVLRGTQLPVLFA